MIGDDPGAQPERTALAWQRTALAQSVIAATAAVGAVRLGFPVLTVAVCLVLGSVIVGLFRRFPTGGMPGHGLYSGRILVRTAIHTAALAACGTALAITLLVGRLA